MKKRAICLIEVDWDDLGTKDIVYLQSEEGIVGPFKLYNSIDGWLISSCGYFDPVNIKFNKHEDKVYKIASKENMFDDYEIILN